MSVDATRAKGTANGKHTKASVHVMDNGVEIVCVGLMRTGLRSVRRALQALGYESFYDQEDIMDSFDGWDKVLRHTHTAQTFKDIFHGAQVAIGMPTFCFWEDILQAYPNARVILTVRDEDDWWNSVIAAKKAMDEELPGAPLTAGTFTRRIEKFLVPSYHKFCEVLRFAWTTMLGMYENDHDMCMHEAAARGNFRKHNCYVESMLKDKMVTLPDGRQVPQLLVFDVNDGWQPLAEFLDRKDRVPPVPFPTESKVSVIPYGEMAHNVRARASDALTTGPSGLPSDALKRRSSKVFTQAERVVTADFMEEWEEMLQEESPLGTQLRSEMRKGLAYLGVVITVVFLLIGLVLMKMSQVPGWLVAIVYVSLMSIVWHTYVVMNSLVMRVPAVVVLSTAMQALWTAASLHACFITYGILKETLVVRAKVASPVLILCSRLMSVLLAVAVLLGQGKKVRLGAPLLDFAAFAFTNEASTWAGYEMLKYVSFPVQVMAKSVKMLPNMIMGRVVNKTHYELSEYMQAVIALVSVGIMHLSEEHAEEDTAGDDGMWKHIMGGFFLALFFVTDSFTSQWQTALYKKHPRLTKVQMMLAGNLLGLAFTFLSFLSRWNKVTSSFLMVLSDPDVLMRVVGLGLCGAAGQFCIYSAIKALGPLSFTWIMTARQLLSVLISLVFFGHGVSIVKLVCIFTVFGVMSWKHIKKLFSADQGATAKAKKLD